MCVLCKQILPVNNPDHVTVCTCHQQNIVSVRVDTHQPKKTNQITSTNTYTAVKSNKYRNYCIVVEYRHNTSNTNKTEYTLRGHEVYDVLNRISIEVYKYLNIQVNSGVNIANMFMTRKLYVMPDTYIGGINPIEKTSDDTTPLCGPATALRQLRSFVERTTKSRGSNAEFNHAEYNALYQKFVYSHGTGKQSPFHGICDIVMLNTGRAIITATHKMHVSIGYDIAEEASVMSSRSEYTTDELRLLFIRQRIKRIWVNNKNTCIRIIQCTPTIDDEFVLCAKDGKITTRVSDSNIESICDIIRTTHDMWYLIRNNTVISPKDAIDRYLGKNIIFIERTLLDNDIIIIYRHPMLHVGFIPFRVHIKKRIKKYIEISNSDCKLNLDFDGDVLDIRVIPSYIAKNLLNEYVARQRTLSGGITFKFNEYVLLALKLMTVDSTPKIPHHIMKHILKNITVFANIENRVVLEYSKLYTGTELVSASLPCITLASPESEFLICDGVLCSSITDTNIYVLYNYLHDISTPIDVRNAIVENIYYVASIWMAFNDTDPPVNSGISVYREKVLKYADVCKRELFNTYNTQYKQQIKSSVVLTRFVTHCISVQKKIKDYAYSFRDEIYDYISPYVKKMFQMPADFVIALYIYNETMMTREELERCINRSILNPIQVIDMACSASCIRTGDSKNKSKEYATMIVQLIRKTNEVRDPGYIMRLLCYSMIIILDEKSQLLLRESRKCVTSRVSNISPQYNITDTLPAYESLCTLLEYTPTVDRLCDIIHKIKLYMESNVIIPDKVFTPYRLSDMLAQYIYNIGCTPDYTRECEYAGFIDYMSENAYMDDVYVPFITEWYEKMHDKGVHNIPISCNLFIYCVYWLHPYIISTFLNIDYMFAAAELIVNDLSYIFNLSDNSSGASMRSINLHSILKHKRGVIFEPLHNITDTLPDCIMSNTSQSFLNGIKTQKINASPISMTISKCSEHLFILFFDKGKSEREITNHVMHHMGDTDLLLHTVYPKELVEIDTLDEDIICMTITVDETSQPLLSNNVTSIEVVCSILVFVLKNIGYTSLPDISTQTQLDDLLNEYVYYENEYTDITTSRKNRITVTTHTTCVTIDVPVIYINNINKGEQDNAVFIMKNYNKHYIRYKHLASLPPVYNISTTPSILNKRYYMPHSTYYTILETKQAVVSRIPPDIVRHDMTITSDLKYMSAYGVHATRQNIAILAAMSDVTPEIALAMVVLLTVTGEYQSLCAINMIQNGYSNINNLLPFERAKEVLKGKFKDDFNTTKVNVYKRLEQTQTQAIDQSNSNMDIKLNIYRTHTKDVLTDAFRTEMYNKYKLEYQVFMSNCDIEF